MSCATYLTKIISAKKSLQRKTFFLDQLTIVHSRNINNHFFLKLLLRYNAEHVQRFFKSWFCTEKKCLILHVFLNGECELMAIL